MKRIAATWTMCIIFCAFMTISWAQDPNALNDALQQTKSMYSQELKVQDDLRKTNQLLIESDSVNKAENNKLHGVLTDLSMEINKFNSDEVTLKSDLSAYKQRYADAENQMSRFKPQWDASQADIARHNSYKPDPRNNNAVDAYNAESNRMNTVKSSLAPERARLLTLVGNLNNDRAALQTRLDASNHKRQDLNNRRNAAEQKRKDLAWSREQITKQTELFAKQQKESNARMNDLVARMNTILNQISRIKECKGTFTSVVDVTNLNGAAEQASRCLQMHFDRASRGDTRPVAPKPPSSITPNN
jgi:chromosome segregation ATPase